MQTPVLTPGVQVIVLRAHLPKQMAIVAQCVEAGHPVTFYADELTPAVEMYGKLSFVQMRIGPMDFIVVDDGKTVIYI